MMDFKLSTQSRTVLLTLKNAENIARESVTRAWFEIGADLKRTASREILRKPKAGITYFRVDKLGRRRRHVASAPGETHANMTGALRRSIGWKVQGDELAFGYGASRDDVPEYAPYLEFGTRRMKPRPSLQNAIRNTRRNAENYFANAATKGFN